LSSGANCIGRWRETSCWQASSGAWPSSPGTSGNPAALVGPAYPFLLDGADGHDHGSMWTTLVGVGPAVVVLVEAGWPLEPQPKGKPKAAAANIATSPFRAMRRTLGAAGADE